MRGALDPGRGRAARPALVLALAALAAACARNPVTGRPEVTLVSTRAEREIGRQQAAEVARTMGLVETPELVAWVDAIGRRLAAHAPGDFSYRFAIVDLPAPNAFALPGGWIYVSRGLLALVNGEDELACVIGHEIGHVAARHAAQRITRAAPLAIATGLPAAATGIVLPRLGGAMAGVGTAASAAMLAPYSRAQEREADRIGERLAAEAGWDPAALGRILRTMGRDEALAGAGGAPRFFATHPSTSERIGAAAAYAATLERAPAAPIAGDRAAVLSRLDGLVLGGSAADGVIDGRRFLHPDLDFAITFPAGWTVYDDRTSVAATPDDERAIAVVEVAGAGSDPTAAARELAQAADLPLGEIRAARINGLPAARAEATVQAKDGPAVLDLTWIVHHGRLFEILGVAAPADYRRHRAAIAATVRSFRPLTANERGSVEETRLRSRPAQAGESLAAFARRTGCRWSGVQVAIANGLDDGAALAAGELLKIARLERYRPAGP